MLLPIIAKAQSSSFELRDKPMVIGLELLQTLPTYIFPDQYRVRNAVIIEPTIGFHTNNRKWTMITAGYAHGYIDEPNVKVLTTERFDGGYLKLSLETQHPSVKSFRVAYGALVSLYAINGTYKFEGANFGDYTGHYSQMSFIPAGHGDLIFDTPISSKFRVRISGQISTGLKTGGDVNTYYIPGMGFATPTGWLVFGFNGGLHLFYNLR